MLQLTARALPTRVRPLRTAGPLTTPGALITSASGQVSGFRTVNVELSENHATALNEQPVLTLPKTEDVRMSGTTDKIEGRVKESIGVLTNNQGLKAEGKLDQKTGKIKNGVARVINEAREAAKAPGSK